MGGVQKRPNVGAGGRDCGVWLCFGFGTTDGMFNWRKVSCEQKFAFATLAMLIAISMLATHTWCANVLL